MANLNLQPNESIILKSSLVSHGEGLLAKYTDDLILTNIRLIHVSKGVYSNSSKTRSYPVNQIKVHDGQAQVILGRNRSLFPQIEIYLRNGHEVFGFMSKNEAVKWVDGINKLLTGNAADPESKKMMALPGTELVTSVIADTFDVVKNVIGSKSKGANADVNVTIKCIGCGAPLSGIRGQGTRCRYCDTDQTL